VLEVPIGWAVTVNMVAFLDLMEIIIREKLTQVNNLFVLQLT
jgi:hypothetical protein